MRRNLGCAFWTQWLLINVLAWALVWILLLATLALENGSGGWSAPAVIAATTGVAVLRCLVLVALHRSVLHRVLPLPARWTRAYVAGLAVGSAATAATLFAASFVDALENIQEVALLGLAGAWLLNGLTQWLVIDRAAPRARSLVAANALNLAAGHLVTLGLIFVPLAMASWNLGDVSAPTFAYVMEYTLIGGAGGAIGGVFAFGLSAPLLNRYQQGQPSPTG